MEMYYHQFFNHKKKYLRDLYYLRRSANDLLDFVFNTILFCLGLYFFSNNELFLLNKDHYLLFLHHKISEINLSILFLCISSINFVRLLYPFRIKLCLVSLLKSLTLFCLLILFFNTVYRSYILENAVIYFILVFFAFRSLIIAK